MISSSHPALISAYPRCLIWWWGGVLGFLLPVPDHTSTLPRLDLGVSAPLNPFESQNPNPLFEFGFEPCPSTGPVEPSASSSYISSPMASFATSLPSFEFDRETLSLDPKNPFFLLSLPCSPKIPSGTAKF